MADFEDEDVPPLEDMSEMLTQVESIREKQQQQKKTQTNLSPHARPHATKLTTQHSGQSTDPLPSESKPTVDNNPRNTEVKETKKESKTSGNFGGMKKGFLFGSSPSKAPKTNAKSVPKPKSVNDSLPLIKPKDPSAAQSTHEMPEVQAAMTASQNLFQNSDWVTNDLLDKVSKNEALLKNLNNPHFTKALSEFQTNPQAAMEKYKGNAEMETFLKEFCGLMGDHFTKLADEQPPPAAGADISVRSSSNPKQPTSEDEQRMEKILADPEIQPILADPQIQTLFQSLRESPDQAQRILHNADPTMKKKINKLIESGLLQMQR